MNTKYSQVIVKAFNQQCSSEPLFGCSLRLDSYLGKASYKKQSANLPITDCVKTRLIREKKKERTKEATSTASARLSGVI